MAESNGSQLPEGCQPSHPPARKPYKSPRLEKLGSVKDLTRGFRSRLNDAISGKVLRG